MQCLQGKLSRSEGVQVYSLIYLEFLMRVWITSLNQTRLVLEYDIHLDNSLIPGEQVRGDIY